MNTRTLKALEFDRVLEHLAAYCFSDASKEHVLNLRPYTQLEELSYEQILFEEASDFYKETAYHISNFLDINHLFIKAQRNHVLFEIDELWALKENLIQASELINLIQERSSLKPTLASIAQPLPSLVISALKRCIQDELNLKDESSNELYAIRTELRRIHQSCLRKVKDYAKVI